MPRCGCQSLSCPVPPGPSCGPWPTSPLSKNCHYLILPPAFLLGVSPAACIHQPPSASALASRPLPDGSSVKSWPLHMGPSCVVTPELSPAPGSVLHPSTPVRNVCAVSHHRNLLLAMIWLADCCPVAVADVDAHLGLASSPLIIYTLHIH